MPDRPTSSPDTVAYYERHASEFAVQTGNLDLDGLHDRFLKYVPPRGRILDAGCGVGRDALAFTRRGYDVVAFDASLEMVRRARKRVGGKAAVHLKWFSEVAWQAEFDGIWACASLLHVPPLEFAGVAARLADALCHGGAWYMSFKLGQGARVAEGRLFVNHDDASLRAALADAPVEMLEVWTSEDVKPHREGERWLNAVARKH